MDNTKAIGNISELEVMLAFMKLGYNILTPYGDNERYDCVVEINDRFYKIQIKTGRELDNGAKFEFPTCSRHYKNGTYFKDTYENQVDFFGVYFQNKVYLIPIETIGGRKSMTLRLLPTKNGQTTNILWASDFEIEKIIQTLH